MKRGTLTLLTVTVFTILTTIASSYGENWLSRALFTWIVVTTTLALVFASSSDILELQLKWKSKRLDARDAEYKKLWEDFITLITRENPK